MAALHDALKTLSPIEYTDVPLDNLESFLKDAFVIAQTIVDSIPIPEPPEKPLPRSRSDSAASSSSEISVSSARSAPPPSDIQGLQKEWKSVKLNARDNPLGMNVYKLGGKDGKGNWFARRSVHEGLGFTKWKKGLEREFPEGIKVEGGPGEGAIRGIGGEKRVAYKNVKDVGKMEVYLLSAQFPGPTTPRDFVTMFLSSDQVASNEDAPRHFMVISKPCIHPDTALRSGFIRGQYESVEYIREIPVHKGFKKSASTTNLPTEGRSSRTRSRSTLSKEAILRNANKNGSPPPFDAAASDSDLLPSETRARGKTISFDKSRGSDAKGEDMDVPREDDGCEQNPVEWIMVTRSDPGGSVPRFMIDRGTPGGIVADAAKFLDWTCGKDIEELQSDNDEELAEEDRDENAQQHKHKHHHKHVKNLENLQTNGHLAGIEEKPTPEDEISDPVSNGGGIYGMVADVAGAAGQYFASHAPNIFSNHLPGQQTETGTEQVNGNTRRDSVSSSSNQSSVASFASALESSETAEANKASSMKSITSAAEVSIAQKQDKELQKLEEKKRKIAEKFTKAREAEISKKTEDITKEEEAIKKAQEKHDREVKRQEEKYKKEIEKLEMKKEKEAKKAEERKKKAAEKDEKVRLTRELEEAKAENEVLKREREMLRGQIGDLQAENTSLAARIGRLGIAGEEVLRDLRREVESGGRQRASSLRGLDRRRSGSSGINRFGRSGSGELLKESLPKSK